VGAAVVGCGLFVGDVVGSAVTVGAGVVGSALGTGLFVGNGVVGFELGAKLRGGGTGFGVDRVSLVSAGCFELTTGPVVGAINIEVGVAGGLVWLMSG